MQAADHAVDGRDGLLFGYLGQVGVTGGGGGACMTEQVLDMAQAQPLLKQMGGVGVATGIVTLLMIRGLVKFTTGTIRTMASPST